VELGRERERRRESSLALKLGQMKGSVMPKTATAIAITPTMASVERACDSTAAPDDEFLPLMCDVGAAWVATKALVHSTSMEGFRMGMVRTKRALFGLAK